MSGRSLTPAQRISLWLLYGVCVIWGVACGLLVALFFKALLS